MKSRSNHCVSRTSPLVTIGPIHGFYVFVVTCTLGWDDGTFPAPKVKGMAYDYYAKCGEVPPSPSAPTLTISYSTPINLPWRP
jgi:hypothetical protein